MTAPRQILPGRTYLVTRRTTQRQFLLRPDEETNAIFAYCLAEAAEHHEIRLIAWLAMSNHYHAVVEDPTGTLPLFLERLHKMIAKAVNEHRGRSENMWSNAETSVVYLPTPADVFDKVVYVLMNPIKGDLVDRVSHWPGISSFGHLCGMRPSTIRRPATFFSARGRMPESVELRLNLSPQVRDGDSETAWRARVRAEIERRERSLRESRAREQRRVLGRKGVLSMSPRDTPNTPEPSSRFRPCVACKDVERRKYELQQLTMFLFEYATALRAFMGGARDVLFPAGTYRMRLLGARCGPLPS